MKKILITLTLLLATGSVVIAQDFNSLIKDLAKIEGVEYQSMDKALLDEQIGSSRGNMPAFMGKVQKVEAVIIEKDQDNISNKITKELAKVKKGSKYESLLKVKEQGTVVEIVGKKNEEESEIFVFVLDEDTCVLVKMTGNFSEQDISDMVKDQLGKVKQTNTP